MSGLTAYSPRGTESDRVDVCTCLDTARRMRVGNVADSLSGDNKDIHARSLEALEASRLLPQNF